MNIKEFIEKFIKITRIKVSVKDIVHETVNRAIEMIDTNDDPLDDRFSEALKLTRNNREIQELVEENQEYYVIFVSSLMVVLEEKLKHIELDRSQKDQLSKVLDEVEVFGEDDV